MAYAAEIDNEGTVLRVLKISDDHDHRIQEHMTVDLGLGGTWIKTSYNTVGGVHSLGGTPLRKNYAGPGFKYDAERDAFIPPKPYPSWVLNDDTCLWNAPVAKPEDDKFYAWDEDTTSWVVIEETPAP